jgi:hypothetical protein
MISATNKFAWVLFAFVASVFISGCSTPIRERRTTITALYAVSISEAFKHDGSGRRLYVVDDPFLADIKARVPAIAQYIRGHQEASSMARGAEDVVYQVTVTNIEETNDSARALVTFYETPENAKVYLIRLKRMQNEWVLLSFDIKGIV